MLDLSHLTELSARLQKSVLEKDVDKIQLLCEQNDAFIRTIVPLDDQESNEKIKQFIQVHQTATQLVNDLHKELKNQLYLVNKSRKSVYQYKGVKNAK